MELQTKVRKFIEQFGQDMPVENWFFDLSSELGEIGKEMNNCTGYGDKNFEQNDEIAMEVGDLFYSLLGFANKLDIDLEKSLNDVLEKYRKRFETRQKFSSH